MTGNCGPEIPILDAMALRLVNAGYRQVLPCQKRATANVPACRIQCQSGRGPSTLSIPGTSSSVAGI